MNPLNHRFAMLANPWTYVVATFAWTWTLCGVLAFGDLADRPGLSGALLLLAMTGPGVTGILFTQLTRDRDERRDYWKRIVDVRRLTWPWLLAAVAIPFGLQITAGVFDGLFGGPGPSWGSAAGEFLADPVTQILSLWIITLVPFFEEMGWRGYAQDRFMERHDATKASLILGLIWSAWHLPAFFVPGTYHQSLGFFSLESLLFFVGVVALSMVVSWIYINTQRSILIMVVFHATVNLAGELIALTDRGEVFFTACWIVFALAIVTVCGRSMQVRRSRATVRRPVVAALLCSCVLAGGGTSAALASTSLQSTLEQIRETYDLPGITAAYARPDGTVEVAASGFADLELDRVMRPESRMLAASIGKTFLGATAASLAAEGAIDLDAPIARWLEDRSWFERLPNHEALTLRHLLTHSAGIGDHVHDPGFEEDAPEIFQDPHGSFDAQRWIGYVLEREPLFEPGTDFAYSDTGYLIAAIVIETAMDRSLTELVSERFLDPLGLSSTTPSNRPDLPDLACSYVAGDNPFGLPRRTLDHEGVMLWNPAIEGAGGGYASTSRDLVVWGKWAFVEGPLMFDRSASVPIAGGPQRYGLGVAFHPGEGLGPTLGHAGWIPGTVSSLRYYLEHDVAVAIQINTDEGVGEVFADVEQRIARVAIGDSQRIERP